MKKRFLAALLAALATALLLPAAAFAESYSLWVNGTEVTSENAGNVLGDSGTVSYDAATNTLTLNGATINTPNPTSVSSIYSAGIYAEGAIQIQLIGENSITISSGQIVAGIHANGVITIGGAGALNVTASGASIETRAISTGYTENEAGIIINGGTVTVDADGTSGIYAVYVDGSYGASTGLPARYFKINGGTVELDAQSTQLYSCWATNTKPDLSGYAGYSATAILNSWEELVAYNETSWGYCRYIKVQPLAYDENGISEDKKHYQPAAQADDGYYEIKNAGNLFWFAEKLKESDANAALNARLVNSITMPEGMNWVAMQVGTYGTPYTGTFDGCGYTISNLSVASNATAGVFNNEGLFKTIGINGVVKNLGMINPSVKPDSGYAGAICGTNYGSIENCYNLGGEISVASMYGGGIVGDNQGAIRECYNTGSVTSQNGSSIGGIAGCTHNGGMIIDCYNTGAITGAWYVGGICGQLDGGTITNCYGTGTATATYPGYASTAHPIAGIRLNGATVENSYYTNDRENNDGGKTAAQFASGEVAYLLNANRSENVWGQALGTQAAPVLRGAAVYRGYASCYAEDISYSNDATAVSDPKPAHNFSVLQYDRQYHWYVCANEGCTATYGHEPHRYVNYRCVVCGVMTGQGSSGIITPDDTLPTAPPDGVEVPQTGDAHGAWLPGAALLTLGAALAAAAACGKKRRAGR